MVAQLVIAAHGTRSAAGSATSAALVAAIAAARAGVPVSLGFLDVATPTVAETLDRIDAEPAVVVPLLLSAGYHVQTDIPALVAGRPAVCVSRHLGPDPLIIEAVAARLAEAGGDGAGPTLLAAIASSRSSARAEVDAAAALLAVRLDRPVGVLPLIGELTLPDRAQVASYLLAEGDFLTNLRSVASGRAVVADPIGVHPALVELVWSRYDEAVRAVR